MNIQEKYELVRPDLKNGDIILFRGKHLLAKLIQYFDRNKDGDKAYYNHVGIIFKSNNRFMVIDSLGRGVHPDFLSVRIHDYTDFCIIRPLNNNLEKSAALQLTFERADLGIKYDFLMLPRIAIAKKFGVDIKKLGTDKRDICSEFVRRYTNFLMIPSYNTGTWITPQEFIRLADPMYIKILYNDSIVK